MPSVEGLTYNKIIKLFESHNDIFKHFQVKKIGIFGSFAKNKANKSSDIDLLVEFKKPTLDNYMDLLFSLESLLGRKVDLITKNSLSPYMKPFVEKEVRWYES